ncbi:hypothetical protein CBF34_00995 [Vagococcus penaei]|uniref:Uncharacterized protein n=1 Tax=Vagococcus penaei TaxID=633807 RepID=A0A1Q2D8B5_9ENTE|nr:flagellar protein FlaG [Vagococcus penaei]AQP54596.1 hypothetical protein BW732_10545 [Vagococcus penaei]RSU06692.1 hypothetical protein CBF34_00995 [Vagococcus penaei]
MDIQPIVHQINRLKPVTDGKIMNDLPDNRPTLPSKLQERVDELVDPHGNIYQAGTISSYSKEKIQEEIAYANRFLVGHQTKFHYQIHEETGRTIVELRDIQTDEIVKEIPPSEFLDVVAEIWKLSGIIVDKEG